MRTRNVLAILIALCASQLLAQQPDRKKVDSMIAALPGARSDTARLWLYTGILYELIDNHDPREALQYAEPALRQARGMGWDEGTAHTLRAIGRMHWRLGQFATALTMQQQALDLYEKAGDTLRVCQVQVAMAQTHIDAGHYTEARATLQEALEQAKQLGNSYQLMLIHSLLSYVHGQQGDLVAAIRETNEQRKIEERTGNLYGLAISTHNLGELHFMLNHLDTALALTHRALEILRSCGKRYEVNEAGSLIQLGQIHSRMDRLPEAEEHFREALELVLPLRSTAPIGSAYQGLGMLHQRQGDDAAALSDFLEAARWMEEGNFDKPALAGVYSLIGMCYTRMGNYAEAASYFARIKAISQEVQSRSVLADYHRGSEFLDSMRGDWRPAYFHSKLYQVYRDSILGSESREKFAQAEVRYDYEKQMLADSLTYESEKAVQAEEIRRQKVVRNGFVGGFALVAVFAVVFLFQRNRISKARKRSDELLLNILPEEVAEELKAKGEAEAVHIDQVTVLFTDFKGFTAMSEKVTPKELVHDLHECFSAFDRIAEKHGIEKIKTIGDAYMAAGGLPTPNTTHATDVIHAAFEMRDFIAEGKARKVAAGLPYFEIRIGIHTGPVVAGIVGVKKFSYDIWGDTVNTASRMESSGEVGQVNISEATYELVKNEPGLTFTPRGKVQAKGKGEMEMYFVEGKPAFVDS